MIEMQFREKANLVQQRAVLLCIEAFGMIGATTFFRCLACHKIVIAKKILDNGACDCSSRKFRETNLSLGEELYWIGRAIIWKTFRK